MGQINTKKLEELARGALLYAYSPYSRIKVGAALLTSNGKVYTGSNVENSSYGLTICAERVAAVKAVSDGALHFKKVVLTSSLSEIIYPCGACRQFLAEFSDDLKVVCVSNSGKRLAEVSLKALLPKAFTLKKKVSTVGQHSTGDLLERPT
jgi:cytidine deaminase